MAIAVYIVGYLLAAAAFYLVAARGAARETVVLRLSNLSAPPSEGYPQEVNDLRAA